MFVLFLTSEISPLHVVSKRFTKTFNGDFRPFLPPGNILKGDRFVDNVVLICKYKVLKYIEVTGFQSKAYQAVSLYHGCH